MATSDPRAERSKRFNRSSSSPAVIVIVAAAIRDLWLTERLLFRVPLCMLTAYAAFVTARVLTSDGRPLGSFDDPAVATALFLYAVSGFAWAYAFALGGITYWQQNLISKLAALAVSYVVAVYFAGDANWRPVFATTLLATSVAVVAEIAATVWALRNERSYRLQQASRFVGVAAAAAMLFFIFGLFTDAQTGTPAEPETTSVERNTP